MNRKQPVQSILTMTGTGVLFNMAWHHQLHWAIFVFVLAWVLLSGCLAFLQGTEEDRQ